MRIVITILAICVVTFSCFVNQNNLDEKFVCEYNLIEKLSFKLKTKEYIEGCNCGTKSCASVLIGETIEKKEIAVFLVCHIDSNILNNEILEIKSIPKPDFYISLPKIISKIPCSYEAVYGEIQIKE